MPVLTTKHYFMLIIFAISSICHEKTLRKIVRNKAKLIQTPLNYSQNVNLIDILLAGHKQTFHENSAMKVGTIKGIFNRDNKDMNPIFRPIPIPKTDTRKRADTHVLFERPLNNSGEPIVIDADTTIAPKEVTKTLQSVPIYNPNNNALTPQPQPLLDTSHLKRLKKCRGIYEAEAVIDANRQLNDLIQRSSYRELSDPVWNTKFEERYETLMQYDKWPPLKVILTPRTHVHGIWEPSFEEYHRNTASKILQNVVKKLRFYKNLTFTWNEVVHLSRWWRDTTRKNRQYFRRFVREGRIEITTGSWTQPDEASTSIFGLLHQLLLGLEWIRNNLQHRVTVAWLTESNIHSTTMAYLLTTARIYHIVLAKTNHIWNKFSAYNQISDFLWVQNWNSTRNCVLSLNPTDIFQTRSNSTEKLHPRSLMTHQLQFDSDSFHGCGPNATLCVKKFDFGLESNKEMVLVNQYTLKETAELLLEQYSKSGTLSVHNIIIASLGDIHRYEKQYDFDYQYNNYLRLAEFVNSNYGVYKTHLTFGTPKDYFRESVKRLQSLLSVKGDFVRFSDVKSKAKAYWFLSYVAHPYLKGILNKMLWFLRSAEILFTLAWNHKAFHYMKVPNDFYRKLIYSRELSATLLGQQAFNVTLSRKLHKVLINEAKLVIRTCKDIQEHSINALFDTDYLGDNQLHKYVLREGEMIANSKIISIGEKIVVFNSLGQQRTEVVEILTKEPNIKIVDHEGQEVAIQLYPVWKLNAKHAMDISDTLYRVVFIVNIPPLVIKMYSLKSSFFDRSTFSTIFCSKCLSNEGEKYKFAIRNIISSEIQLENEKIRLVFNSTDGFLKSMIEKDSGKTKILRIDFGAIENIAAYSGTNAFKTKRKLDLDELLGSSKQTHGHKILGIIIGPIFSEIFIEHGRLIKQKIRLYNVTDSYISKALYLEHKFNFDGLQLTKDLIFHMTVQSDISNGEHFNIYTDSNGFQFVKRSINSSYPFETNVYPITQAVFIEDYKSRITILADHSQGVTSLGQGQINLILDRFNNAPVFNLNNERIPNPKFTGVSFHKHVILIEDTLQSIKAFQNIDDCLLSQYNHMPHEYPADVYRIIPGSYDTLDATSLKQEFLESIAKALNQNSKDDIPIQLLGQNDAKQNNENLRYKDFYGFKNLRQTQRVPSDLIYKLIDAILYPIDVFILNSAESDIKWGHRSFIKSDFPSDVNLIHYRSVIRNDSEVSSALLILQRRVMSCEFSSFSNENSNEDSEFTLHNIIYNTKAVYSTHLMYAEGGTLIKEITDKLLPPMELGYFKIEF